jgi:NAD dependent epimerase/dehydratase family enzyme
LKNYKNNQTTKINSKKLELNIVHVDDIINFVNTLLNENEISGSYCLKQFKNVKISNLIHNINKQLVKNNKKKLSVEFQNKKIDKIKLSKIKISDKWKPAKYIEKKIIKEFIK